MQRYTVAARVGVFVVAMVVLGLAVYRFIEKTATSKDGYTVYALLDDATGIAKRSQVRMAGIPVGTIKSIRLEHGKARVDIHMYPDVKLYDDATVSKVSSSLLGEYFLAIAAGTEGKRELEDGDQIRYVVQGVSTDQIMKQVADIAQDVKKVSLALAESIGTEEGKEYLKDTLKNLAEVTDGLNATVRENRESIRNILANVEGITAKGGPEVERILENVRETTRDVRRLVNKPDNGKNVGEIRQIIDKVNRASDSLESTLRNVDTVSQRLAEGKGTLGRLSKDETLINEVEGVAQSVGEFMGGISRLQTIVLLRTDYQFLASTVKSYVELRLQPREDKYYAIEIVNDPRGLTRFEQIDVDTTNPNDPPHYREVRTVTTNAFRFSLQFAQRIGPFTGRFGIKESTGGVGLDLSLFEDRFELRQDLFGFGEVVVPRWRVGFGYEFVNRLWLLGGVDDILNSTRRDYFVGLQLKFNDEDIKTILPFTPAP